jgi:hypothetical protein
MNNPALKALWAILSPSQLAEIAAYEGEPKSSSAQFDTTLRVLSKKLVDNKARRKKELL